MRIYNCFSVCKGGVIVKEAFFVVFILIEVNLRRLLLNFQSFPIVDDKILFRKIFLNF